MEAVDDAILDLLAKGHTERDFETAVGLLRSVGIQMAPTFVAFTPWTTMEGYQRMLSRLAELDLIQNVPPVQYTIRLLVPEGSHLFKLEGFERLVDDFDPGLLGYPWRHRDPRVDALQRDLREIVERAEQSDWDRLRTFEAIWRLSLIHISEPTRPC